MPTLNLKPEELEREQRRPENCRSVVLEDLSLFVSLCVAWLMVRWTVQRQEKERETRLKLIKLAPNPGVVHASQESSGEPQ
jgi:hypothetical protein